MYIRMYMARSNVNQLLPSGHQGLQDEVNSDSMRALAEYVDEYTKLFGMTMHGQDSGFL